MGLYLYLECDELIWTSSHIDIFQVAMITIYLVLNLVLAVLLYLNAKEQYLLFHILPFIDSLPVMRNEYLIDERLKTIINHYFGMTVIPIRRAMVIDHFGADLGPIIVSYLPNDDEFEDAGNVVKVTTVV